MKNAIVSILILLVISMGVSSHAANQQMHRELQDESPAPSIAEGDEPTVAPTIEETPEETEEPTIEDATPAPTMEDDTPAPTVEGGSNTTESPASSPTSGSFAYDSAMTVLAIVSALF